jgi:hypothetical protein
MQDARALIELVQARKGLLTVFVRQLEKSDDLAVKIAAAELRDDPHWHMFRREIPWYNRRRRKIARRG